MKRASAEHIRFWVPITQNNNPTVQTGGYRFVVFSKHLVSQLKHLKRSGFKFAFLGGGTFWCCFCSYNLFLIHIFHISHIACCGIKWVLQTAECRQIIKFFFFTVFRRCLRTFDAKCLNSVSLCINLSIFIFSKFASLKSALFIRFIFMDLAKFIEKRKNY